MATHSRLQGGASNVQHANTDAAENHISTPDAPAYTYARAAKALRRNYGTVATKARQSYRHAGRVIRQHRGISIAIMVLGVGVAAGIWSVWSLERGGSCSVRRPSGHTDHLRNVDGADDPSVSSTAMKSIAGPAELPPTG
jgi:hypothetical protein